MRILATCILCLLLAASNAIAAGKPKPQGLVVTQDIADFDGNNVAYSIQSDGTGVYKDGLAGGVSGDVSVMMDNVCGGLTYGDRLLELAPAEVRKVKFTLTSENAVQPGEPGYQVPAQPLGTVLNSVRLMNRCTCATNQSMYTMTAGSKIYCPMHAKFMPFSSDHYVLDMGNDATNGSEQVQISCLAASNNHCTEWSIDPSSDPDFTPNPGRTRATLNYYSTYHGHETVTNKGGFYMTFHIHVTLP